jgi:hypothetical protein
MACEAKTVHVVTVVVGADFPNGHLRPHSHWPSCGLRIRQHSVSTRGVRLQRARSGDGPPRLAKVSIALLSPLPRMMLLLHARRQVGAIAGVRTGLGQSAPASAERAPHRGEPPLVASTFEKRTACFANSAANAACRLLTISAVGWLLKPLSWGGSFWRSWPRS